MINYTDTIDKMETQLNVWGAQIKLLEAKIENSGTDFKLKHASEMNQLRAKQHTATEKIKEMKKSTNEAWDQVKATADKLWDDLKTGIANAHTNII